MSERNFQMRYTSPGGKEITLDYEVVSRETELKTGVFTFPSRDGAHVQHQGAGATTLPVTAFFSGTAYMDKADEFEAMLIEPGVGELQHPYGVYKVVPTGNIKRDDDFVNGIGQSVVAITFTETIVDEDASELDAVAADEIEAQYDEFADAAAENFVSGLDTDDIAEQLAVQSALEAQTQTLVDNLKPIAASDKKSLADWLTSVKELKDNIKNLYKKGTDIAKKAESVYVTGQNIARLTLHVMKMPSEVAVSLSEKISGYAAVTAALINQFKNDPFGIEKIKKAYATAKLGLTGAVASIASGSAVTIAEVAASNGSKSAAQGGATSSSSGSTSSSPGSASGSSSSGGSASGSGAVGSAASAGVASREEAIEASNQVLNMMDAVLEFSDTKIAQDVFVDSDSQAFLALVELVQNSVSLIQNAAFALPMQRTIKLDRDRNVIELCAELYGSVDVGIIDQFIIENNLNIDEIQLLPMGREVSYYVQSA